MTLHPNVTPSSRGFVASGKSSLERFLEKCIFDPTTGCVLWIGGTTCGRGKSAKYGSFKDAGKRWFAHRWSAVNIHGLDIDGMHVDHNCPLDRAGPGHPLPPNTLCVRHVQALSNGENVMLMHERRTWVLTQKGYYEAPPLFDELRAPPESHALPLHEPPEWWPVDKAVNSRDDDCPF